MGEANGLGWGRLAVVGSLVDNKCSIVYEEYNYTKRTRKYYTSCNANWMLRVLQPLERTSRLHLHMMHTIFAKQSFRTY